MKQYATLLIGETDFELFDEKRNIILYGEKPITYYKYQESIVFNMLSAQGWDYVYKMNDDLFMMSKECDN